MKEEGAKQEGLRPWWRNCVEEATEETLAIDKMEEAIEVLDEQATKIRWLIAGFESCYHEADIEAERIVKAIGAGRCPRQSTARPAKRKRELQNTHKILSRWCKNPDVKNINLSVGGIKAKELLSFIGEASPLKVWQVERIVDKVTEALDKSQSYHMMAFDLRDYVPAAKPPGEHYKDATEFLEQTKKIMIRDTVDGREAKMSLAMAIDMLEPCNWDFAGSIVTLLKAIGGELHPERPYACHQRNLKLSPLCERLMTISNTLGVFWREEETNEKTDQNILHYLGEVTPVRRWLAASLDATIRMQLEAPSDFWLTFS